MSGRSVSFDTLLDLCRDQHRRIVLGTLAEEERSLTLNDLTTAVVRYNHHTPVTEASTDLLTETRLSLYHVHVPKLAAEGLVDFDQERRVVEPTDQFEQVQPTLTTILEADPSLEAPMEL